MPQMGVSVAEGTVVAWRVSEGDSIAADETICEISTDKIDTEVPAPVSGVVTEILVPVETTVSVGTVLARIATGAAPGSAPVPSSAPAHDAPAARAQDAAPAPTHDAPQTSRHDAPESGASVREAPASGNGAGRRYSPVVQRIASEHGINLEQVPGTGRGGRVRKQDVLAFIEGGPGGAAETRGAAAETRGAAAEARAAAAEAPLHIESPYRPDAAPPGGQLSRMRRQIGEHMKRSLETAAHCTTWIEVDMSRIEAARTRMGFTALPLVARATIAALREHPAMNAWLEGERYTQVHELNLGI